MNRRDRSPENWYRLQLYACSNANGTRSRLWFSELKLRMGLQRVRLRRLWNVSEQFYLAATAQNLKRLVRFLAQQAPCSTKLRAR